jgi:peptidoglycan/LPS O-acetylase OafA/YrhL
MPSYTGTVALSAVPWACAFLSIFFLAQRFVFVSVTELDRRIPMDALFFGVNLAYLNVHRPSALRRVAEYRVPLLACAAALLLPSFLTSGTLQLTLGLTAVYIAYGIVLVCFIHLRPGSWMDWPVTRFIAFIGTYSYSIYLWHRDTSWEAYELALRAGNRLGLAHELTWVLYTSSYVMASVVGGMALARLIETPVQRMRETLFPPRVSTTGGLGDRARPFTPGVDEPAQSLLPDN